MTSSPRPCAPSTPSATTPASAPGSPRSPATAQPIFCAGVGFDRRGARLGHGAGFYDRALAFRRTRRHWQGPRLVGLAYHFQVVPHIPVVDTDVFMDLLVTDRGIDELLADED